MLKKTVTIIALLVVLLSCGTNVFQTETSDLNAFKNNLELVISDGSQRTIETDVFEITSLDVTVISDGTGLIVAEETWVPGNGYAPMFITIDQAGYYTITVTHHAENETEAISFEESARIRIKSMIISRVRIIPGSIGISEVSDLLFNSLIASYQFNGSADDSSMYGNDGIVNDAVLTTDRNGNSDSAYMFTTASGINMPGDFIDCGKTASITSIDTEITVAAWVKPALLGKRIMGRFSNLSLGGWALSVDNTGFYNFSVSDGTTSHRVDSTVAATVGSYNYVACVYSKLTGQFTISVDGVEAAGTNFTTGVFNYTDAQWPQCENLEIGRFWSSGWSYFTGTIDEVSIYDIALTADQIENIK